MLHPTGWLMRLASYRSLFVLTFRMPMLTCSFLTFHRLGSYTDHRFPTAQRGIPKQDNTRNTQVNQTHSLPEREDAH